MDEDLKRRFLIKKIQEFKANSCQPFPTILCEIGNIKIIDLVRQNCLWAMKLSNNFVPVRYSIKSDYVEEKLEIDRGKKDFGDLYILVNIN